MTKPAVDACRPFRPVIAAHLVKLACELPDKAGRSLSLWTCAELARTAIERGVVESISPQSVQRILQSQKLKPWRVHHWLSPKVEMDEAFRATVLEVMDLYTRAPAPHEQLWSLDEKTSLQPRTRSAPNLPAQPGNVPIYVEHEYARKGALQLFAAFNTQTGKALGLLRRRKRQVEFIELLATIEAQAGSEVTQVHLNCDNISIHKGKLVRAWLQRHPRFHVHFTPVHCSWMNQVDSGSRSCSASGSPHPISPTSMLSRSVCMPSSTNGTTTLIPSTGRRSRSTRSSPRSMSLWSPPHEPGHFSVAVYLAQLQPNRRAPRGAVKVGSFRPRSTAARKLAITAGRGSKAVAVIVIVIVSVIVAALVNGNDAVSVIDAVGDDATGGWERPIARACSIFRSSTCTSARSNSLLWHIAYVNGCPRGTRTWPINFVAPRSRFRKTSLRVAAGQREPTRPSTTRSQGARRWSLLRTSTSCE